MIMKIDILLRNKEKRPKLVAMATGFLKTVVTNDGH